MESHRKEIGLAYDLPASCGDRVLHIVPLYKHVGTYFNSNLGLMQEAAHRAASTMSAFVPLAGRVFGNCAIPFHIRMHFMTSLLMPRLVFNGGMWVPTVAMLRKINVTYMRVLRRITNQMRFDSSVDANDITVRRMAKAPSIDCILQRARLLFMVRIIVDGPSTLIALLQQSHHGRQLKWVELLKQDMRSLRNRVSTCWEALPDPQHDGAAFAWFDFFKQQRDKANHMIAQLFFYESVLDVRKSIQDTSLTFNCADCDSSFASSKALAQHRRVAHGITSSVKHFIDDSGMCPICGTNFRSRLRVISHLSDVRRPACRDKVLSGEVQRLDAAKLKAFQCADREALTHARKRGHSHVIAEGPAITRTGRVTGRVHL